MQRLLTIMRASFCSSSTASTSLAAWLMLMTYAARLLVPRRAATRNVSSTSRT
jgi:hypothetical protein